MRTLEIAEIMVKLLKENDFVVQRYNAMTSDSVYLKLDFGTCNSIRIATHGGKKHLKYRYNVIIGGKTKKTQDTYERYFYNERDLHILMKQILKDKRSKLQKYGVDGYQSWMDKNKKRRLA